MITDESKVFHVDLRSCFKCSKHRGLLQSWWFYKQTFHNRSYFGKVLSDVGDLTQVILDENFVDLFPI